jgi:hypothetical protein
MSFQKNNSLESCSLFLRHVPQRAASVVTRSLMRSGAPIALPYLDDIADGVVVDIHVSNFRELFAADDFEAPDHAYLAAILRAVARTGGDIVSVTPEGLCVVFTNRDTAPGLATGTAGSAGGASSAASKKALVSCATVCAFDIQDAAGTHPKAAGGPATVKAGISVGRLFLVHAGGRDGHKRRVVVGGAAHRTATHAARLAGTGEIAVCPDSFKLLQEQRFQHRAMRQRFYVLLRNRDSLAQVVVPGAPASPFMDATGALVVTAERAEELEVESELEAYVSPKLSSNFSLFERGKEQWLNSKDFGTVLCIRVKVDLNPASE